MSLPNKKKPAGRPQYIGWRAEMLAKLALSRVGNLQIDEQSGGKDERYDFRVSLGESLRFNVEVKAFSSIQRGISEIDKKPSLSWTLPLRLVAKAKLEPDPLVLFVFDADTEHGRFLRIDDIEISNSDRSSIKVHLPLKNTITTQALYRLLEEMRQPLVQGIQSIQPTATAVVFDTNAYLSITRKREVAEARRIGRDLRDHEQRIGCVALAHPIVIWELLSHLADKSSPHYAWRLNALVALGEHTAQESGAVRLIADFETNLCRALFDRLPPGAEQGLQNLGSLVTHITKYAPKLDHPVADQNIRMLASGMQAREDQWLVDMDKVVSDLSQETLNKVSGATSARDARHNAKQYFDSEAFANVWASYFVTRCAAKVGVFGLTAAEIQDKARIVQQTFPVPIRLLADLLAQIITNREMDLKNRSRKRWNFIWDSMIAFTVGKGLIQGIEVNLVTEDKMIIEAGASAGFGSSIAKLDDYLRRIGMRS